MSHCPECGNPYQDGLTCEEQFHYVLSWEWHDLALSAKHFLTVASYNLQHPSQFTVESLAALQTIFITHLDEGVPIDQLRRRMARHADGSQRVVVPVAERQPVLRTWPLTIAHVYHANQPDGAAERVQAWAEAIRTAL